MHLVRDKLKGFTMKRAHTKNNVLDDLFIEVFILLLGLFTYLVLVLPAAMLVTLEKHSPPPPGFVSISLIPCEGASEIPPMDIGSDIGILVYDSSNPPAYHGDRMYDPSRSPHVKFSAVPGKNYSVGFRGEVNNLKAVLWLESLATRGLDDEGYITALEKGIRLAVYPSSESFVIQRAIADRTIDDSDARIVVLRSEDGFSTEVEIDKELIEGK